ncbi:FIP1[V]-like protein [Phragmites australis]|uniref:FIP1[V]-like protein n=1 Tax=Phragmites australis TaxID=29695 RepID=UPI002D76BCE2|nr:FIP1[V]-like protein [Phragmites australis]
MTNPVDSPTAADAPATNEDDDVDDLYADLDEQVAAALAAAGESGGSNARDSDPATDGEGEVPDADAAAEANEAVDLGDETAGYSSSDEDSDDGLRIVLNEDAGAPFPPPPPPAGRGEWHVADDEEGEDSSSRVKDPSVNDGGWGKIGGLQSKGLLEKTTIPITEQGDRGRQHVFHSDFKFCLPRNSTIFDINIEAFQQKTWRQQGVDLTDYFNFGLDEEGWRKYWFSMKQLRHGARSLANEAPGCDQESYKLKSINVMPEVANYSGFEGRNGLAKPKGRAIHVEGSVCERVPSADMWRPIQRDSDVVIQVNMMLSPSNQSNSDDSSTLNHKRATTKKISIDHSGDRLLKDSSFVVDKVVGKEVHDGGSSDCTGSKLDRRGSSCARDQSSNPDYSDTLSEESKDDFYEYTKLKDEHVKSAFYHHSSKSDQEYSGFDNRSCTLSPVDDRNHKATKLLWRDEAPLAGRGKPSDFSLDFKSDQRLLEAAHNARKEQKRQCLDGGRHAVFDVQEKSVDSYPSRYGRKYDRKRSSSTSLRNYYHNAVHNQLCDKQDYSPRERVALRNDEHYFSKESNRHRRRSSWHEISEGDNVVESSSAKEWQQHRDHVYHSMLKAEISNDNDGRMHKERYYQEMKRVKNDHSVDDEFLHYTDYRYSKLQSLEVRGKYINKGRCAKRNDERLRHSDHLVLYPQTNDSLKSSERDWPAAGLTFMSSRNMCIDNNRIRNAKMVEYHCDGYHQKNKHHDSSFRIGNIPRSALYTDAVAETGRCILPVKRKINADLGSMNRKDLANLALPKGRRLMHDQSMVSDRKIYAVKLHKSTKENYTEVICSSNDMRNSNTVSNIFVERRHQLENADNIHLNDRKIKFKRRGNELMRVIEHDSKGCLSVDKGFHSSKRKDVHQNARKQNAGYHHSGNQNLDKSMCQTWKNEEDAEIEEGELVEQDHQDTISKSKLNKPRKVLLKSVIETSSVEQLQVINAMPKDAARNNGATRECDNRHILEVMEKMQKRRERFKEAITPQKEEDGDKKELSAVACSADDILNQRPARKRRWGGNG